MAVRNEPIRAEDIAASGATNYPEPFAAGMKKRTKAKLGEPAYGLANFGVNRTTLAPGGFSALFHKHSHQDEFLYILEGNPTLRLGDREFPMGPGDCVGFPAGSDEGHHLVNRTERPVVYIEVGDRSVGDEVVYPDDDIAARMTPAGKWAFVHKDGRPY